MPLGYEDDQYGGPGREPGTRPPWPADREPMKSGSKKKRGKRSKQTRQQHQAPIQARTAH